MNASIVTDKLTKKYPGTHAPSLDSLSISVERGEVYGFLGANGAGKSTTIRLLMNFLQPSSGSAQIMGLDSVKQSVEVKKHVGYLSGDVALYQKATGRDMLGFLARLQGKVDAEYLADLEKRFEAELDKPISSLSKGNRQKIGILQALMHRPAVLILDEPTSGLDPLMQEVFYQTIAEAKNRGAAVFMSSHNLAEAQRVCSRVGIIKHGKLIREQTIGDDVSFGKPVFRVTFTQHESLAALKQLPALKILSQFDSNGVVIQPTDSIADALRVLSTFAISDFKTTQPDLEDEFLEFYGDAT